MTPLEALDLITGRLWGRGAIHGQQEALAVLRAALTPRVVTTTEELDALPSDTVVRGRHFLSVFVATDATTSGRRWYAAATPGTQSTTDMLRYGPFTVVWTPPQSAPEVRLGGNPDPAPDDQPSDAAQPDDAEALPPAPQRWVRMGDYQAACRNLDHALRERDAARADLAARDRDLTELREGIEALVSEDSRRSGREVSCGGYSITDDGCHAGDLAGRLRALLGGKP